MPAPLGSGARFAALKKKAKPAAPADDQTPDPATPPGKRKKLAPGAMQAIARGQKAPPAK
jgi:hypothetical protein